MPHTTPHTQPRRFSPARPCFIEDVPHWDLETDVVVVGFGAAGACAAIEARQAGARVRVLEVASAGGGSASWSGGEVYVGGSGGTSGITSPLASAPDATQNAPNTPIRRGMMPALLFPPAFPATTLPVPGMFPCPGTPSPGRVFLSAFIMGEGGTYHLIDEKAISLMKDDVMLTNAARGGLIDTEALIAALKQGKFHAVALDVYEGEGKYEGMAGGVVVDFNGVPVRIGGGFTDQQRAEIWADFKGVSVTYSYTSWEEELDEMITVTEKVKPSGQSVIGRLIEVKYHEITPDGSMRHPRFARFRDLLEKGEKV